MSNPLPEEIDIFVPWTLDSFFNCVSTLYTYFLELFKDIHTLYDISCCKVVSEIA